MTEHNREGLLTNESVRKLPDAISRQLLIVKGRSGLLTEDLNDDLVENQARFGKGTDDYLAMAEAHQLNAGGDVLGIHEEVRRRRIVTVGGVETEFIEADPKVKNIWVGKYVKLLTPEEAAETPYAGQTALKWATINGKSPEMVVKANNGYFYPATKNDIAISSKRF